MALSLKPSGPSPLTQLNSHYDKLGEAQAKLKVAREGMDALVAMGDSVGLPDVVKVAGRLVAEGLDPGAMASLLADAPEKTEFLVQWLQEQDKQIAQREEDVARTQLVVRHQMGVEGLRELMQPQEPATPQAPAVPSALALPPASTSDTANG